MKKNRKRFQAAYCQANNDMRHAGLSPDMDQLFKRWKEKDLGKSEQHHVGCYVHTDVEVAWRLWQLKK